MYYRQNSEINRLDYNRHIHDYNPIKYVGIGILATLCAGTAFAGDGSKEPGFVPPPKAKKLPSAPPRTASSAETFIPGGCTTPMSRTESKKPPRPPVLVTKLKDK
tara:strand:- start:375 stop:689 length:315 start_codon:yes stop_codon:yes gene_type:complete